jgi:Ribonuclease toxin, BrnT, of type II toxin-antitoxin system
MVIQALSASWLPGDPARRSLTKETSVHTLDRVSIDWDPHKAEDNLRAHGVRFSEAATVLTDDYALTREDPDALKEQRFGRQTSAKEAV